MEHVQIGVHGCHAVNDFQCIYLSADALFRGTRRTVVSVVEWTFFVVIRRIYAGEGDMAEWTPLAVATPQPLPPTIPEPAPATPQPEPPPVAPKNQ